MLAVAAGVPTVADKLLTSRPGRRRGRELVAAAKDAGVPLNGFHNRRWDIRAVAALLETTRPTGDPTTDPSPGAARCEAEPDLAWISLPPCNPCAGLTRSSRRRDNKQSQEWETDMLWYCKYKWHPNTTVEALRTRILEQDAAGTNQPKQIRGWYDLAGGGAGFMLIETDEPRELTNMLQPYMDLLSWDVHAVTEQPSYDAIIESFRQKAG